MALGRLTPNAVAAFLQPRSAWRAAASVGAIYLAARIVTTAFFLIAGALAPPDGRHGVDPSLDRLFVGWDGQWYWKIGEQGYETQIPRDATGAIHENAWAFMPLFPWLARIVGAVTGGWAAGAAVVVVVAGYAACLALFHLWRERLGETASLWAVAFVAAGPLGALFQVAYAESLFLALLMSALLAVQRRTYVWLYPLILTAGFTRPGILAFALFLGLVTIVRWMRRRAVAVGRRELAHLVASSVWAVLVGAAWPVIASTATGDPAAYLDTELAWRRAWGLGEGAFVPFRGWIEGGIFWFGSAWALPAALGVVVACVLVVIAAIVLIVEPHVRRLGADVRLWSASYLLYLVAVFFPQTSLFRLMLPLAPLAGALAVPRSRWWRVVVLLGGLVGQWWWIWNMYALGEHYWQIP